MKKAPNFNAVLRLVLLASLGAAGSALADGTNPYHLEASVISPFDYAGVVTSYAPSHHVVFGGDTSFDVALQSGSTGGTNVWFDVKPYYLATAMRGVVLSGGANAPVPACASGNYYDGGYVVQVEVQAYYNGTWTPIGWVKYAHVDSITVNNGAVISNTYQIAKATWQYNGRCSTAPHVHIEPYNYRHYACYTNRSPFQYYDAVARVGGGRLGLSQCP
ncbi:MAG TPA: hypothetical protein VF794_18335 [Archangium sp.]|jgi:hypothetical protein|uniref:hypothetical protein n=1 Tax=Archangium sp. TaxID=1872627 RepID=UPI002ED8A0BF